jgi:PAS domain S-box-containing protein
VHDFELRIAELVRQNQAFQFILDEMPAAVFLQDREGRFGFVNRAWERLTGISRDAALGRTVFDIFPAEAAALRRADLAVLESGAATEREVVLNVPAGSRTYLTQLFPVRDAEQRVVCLAGLALDITDRKRAEEAQARLGRAVEHAGESIVVTDPAGTIVDVNPAFETASGYSAAEAIGQNSRILKSGHQDAAFYRRMWETLRRGDVWKGRIVNRRKDGALYQEDATISPVRDSAGRLCHYVAVKRDVTHEMQLERQLAQAQKMEAIGRLAGGVAHDFNNLLGVISGYSELARRKLGDDHPLSAKLDEILKAADRAAGLTRQLLAFSRRQVLQPTVLDLNALVTDVQKMLGRLIGEDVRLATSLDPALDRVRADAGQLEQVLMNLAVNARDAMPDGGRLGIETRNAELDEAYAAGHVPIPPGSYVMLAVSDTGTGMDAETQARAFEPFFTTKGVGQGTGLGLSMVYGIVKQSGGYIWCYSEPGVGTTFKIYLPRVEDALSPTRRVQAALPRPGTETLLLIEDDAALRELLCETLGEGGYTVLVADGGTKALTIASEYSGTIHMIVTDVVMPGLNGREAVAQVKAVRPEAAVLFISGYTDDAIARHGVLDPGVHFLSKPFGTNELLGKVRGILDGR